MTRTALPALAGFTALCLLLLCPASRSDTGSQRWRVVGPGGGGAMFLPTISPHDPKVVFVACDMTGSYLTSDGGANWRMFNLRGRTTVFAFDPVTPGTLYAYGTGLYRSTDGGLRWQLLYPAPRNVRFVAVAGDHADETLRVANGPEESITALAVDPADSRTLYAAMGPRGESTLRISTDWGESWQSAGALSDGARAIYIDAASPRTGRTIYVVGNTGVAVRAPSDWKSGAPAPGGAFVSVSGGFSAPGSAGQSRALTIYGATNAGLVISTDGGASWRSLLPGLQIRSVATSLHHSATAYVSYSGLKKGAREYFGVAVTRDGGQTWAYPWQESNLAAPNVDQGGWINPTLGPGWGEHPLDLGVSPVNPDLCYATDFGRTLRTADGGRTWAATYTRRAGPASYTSTGLDVTTAYGVHFDPFDPRRTFITYTDIGLMRSEDAGASWRTAIQHGVPRPWTNTTYWVAFDPEVKGRMWAVFSGTHDLPHPKMWRHTPPARFQGGVCRSDDGGETWTAQRNGMPETAATHILLDRRSPKDARVLYVAGFGKGVFKSTDGGATWAPRNHGLPANEPFAWRLSMAGDGALYLVLARRSEDGSIGDEKDGALYRSRDGAESWQMVVLPEDVNGPAGLTVDPTDAQRIYLSAWGRKGVDRDSGGGIYLSRDAGASWRRTLDRDAHIYDVTVDPADPAHLFACGFESSVWRSLDRGGTWSRVPGYNFKWGHRVVPDPLHRGMLYVTTFGGSVWYGPETGDPGAGEDIDTPIVATREKR